MWPSAFEYQRPVSLAEALQVLSDHEDAKVLAGGHSLLPAMKLRLAEHEMLVDIGRLSELKEIITIRNGGVKIGALATHAEIAASVDVQRACPALASAAGMVGDQQVRNWGTLGGNLAHSDPASDPTTVVLACGGTIQIQSASGSRSVSADDFFIDLFTVDINPGELITSVELPDLSRHKSAYVKMAHPASRYAVVGVGVVLEMSGNTCTSARVAVGGATVKPTRAPGAESALAGSTLDEAALNAAADAVKSDIADMLIGDMNYPEDYRQEMAGVYLKRAVRAALS
ncbi:MAG: xanthine dehydrogenase family protein subunit M [Anaerolineae bacterium]|nr:xanthine dehydrogenase family protein subunit M [Anaerolineae bacterium]